jgi:hypothetical protein
VSTLLAFYPKYKLYRKVATDKGGLAPQIFGGINFSRGLQKNKKRLTKKIEFLAERAKFYRSTKTSDTQTSKTLSVG